MQLYIVRHAEPDYAIDSLTEKGWREAEYLARRLSEVPAADYYVSPLGRARDTASLTLKRVGRTARECQWLREFQPRICRPDRADGCCWQWLPQDWLSEPRFLLPEEWYLPPALAGAGVKAEYDWVAAGLDGVLADHGYRREGRLYRVERPNHDILVFFCHFGVECVLLSHLLNVSPLPLWHGFRAPPSSVTVLSTEERRRGAALFRVQTFGDTGHLYAHGEGTSVAGVFCECYDDPDGRHD